MKKRKLLTLQNLYDYYASQTENIHFSSAQTHGNIVVQAEGIIRFGQNDKNKEGLLPVTLQSCHTLKNINGSNITEEVMNTALPSFSNRPILGYIHKVNDQYEFNTHAMHLDENDELVYDEVPVGIVPESCNARLEYDEEKGKTYCVVDGYIFEEYSKAAEILQREKECAVSVELNIRELSYNASEKYLNIEDFYFEGVTILGKTEEGKEVKPGMVGSNIQLSDFSKQNNSMFSYDDNKLIATLEKLTHTLSTISNFNISEERKEEQRQMKFEELLNKYNKTVEDITFEYEGLSDEELEAIFAETFEELGDPIEPTNDPKPEVFQKVFELSHSDVRVALYNLLAPFEEVDNEWYFISSVYDSHFIYENWDGNKIFGQNYAKDGDYVSFDGERYNLHRELLTDTEFAELQSMRSNYASLQEQLSVYQKAEEKANKDKLFESGEYEVISTSEEFVSLKENHEDFTLDELKEKLDNTLLTYAKSGNLSFANATEKVKPVRQIGLPITTPKKKSRYGSIFDK